MLKVTQAIVLVIVILVSISLLSEGATIGSGLLAMGLIGFSIFLAWKFKLLKLVTITAFLLGSFIIIYTLGNVFSSSETAVVVEKICTPAPNKYLSDISSGMINDSLTVTDGFTSNLSSKQIDELMKILPSYISPTIIAAKIRGESITSDTVVGTWAIQELSGAKRITALDSNAKRYSIWGSETSNDSAAGKLRSLLLQFSQTTNVKQCAFIVDTGNESRIEGTSSMATGIDTTSKTNSENGPQTQNQPRAPKETPSNNTSTKKPKVESEINSNPEPLVCEVLSNFIIPNLCARKIGKKVEFAGTAQPGTVVVAYIKDLYGSTPNDWIEIKSRLLADREGNFFIPAFDILDGGWALRVKQDFNGNFSNEVAVWKE